MNIRIIFWGCLLLVPMQTNSIVIYLNGTGSAGKTSIANALMKQYPGRFERVSFDTVVWTGLMNTAINYGYLQVGVSYDEAKKTIEQFARSTTDFLWKNSHFDSSDVYKRTYELVAAGKDVIIDMGLQGIQDLVSSCQYLQGLSVMFVLVYCPANTLPDHVNQRNTSGKTGEKRLLRWAVQEFVQMYQTGAQPTSIDTLMNYDFCQLIDKVRIEFEDLIIAEVPEQREKMKVEMRDWLDRMHKLCSHQFNSTTCSSCFLQPKLTYDLVVNTAHHSPEQGAQLVMRYADQHPEFCALQQNYHCLRFEGGHEQVPSKS